MNCDPCDSTELLPQPITATSGSDLQALALASLPPLPDPSCGFRPDEASYQATLVPEQPLDLGQAFMASQMSDMGISMAGGMQDAGSEVANSLIERWVCRGRGGYCCVHVPKSFCVKSKYLKLIN